MSIQLSHNLVVIGSKTSRDLRQVLAWLEVFSYVMQAQACRSRAIAAWSDSAGRRARGGPPSLISIRAEVARVLMISCYSCQLDYQGRVTKNFWLMCSCCLLAWTYVLLFVLVWSKVISLYFSFQSPHCPYYLFHLSYNDQSNDGLMLLLLSCCCCCCLMSSKVSSLYFLFLVIITSLWPQLPWRGRGHKPTCSGFLFFLLLSQL